MPTSVSEMFQNKYKRDKPYFNGLPVYSFTNADRMAYYNAEENNYPKFKQGKKRNIKVFASLSSRNLFL